MRVGGALRRTNMAEGVGLSLFSNRRRQLGERLPLLEQDTLPKESTVGNRHEGLLSFMSSQFSLSSYPTSVLPKTLILNLMGCRRLPIHFRSFLWCLRPCLLKDPPLTLSALRQTWDSLSMSTGIVRDSRPQGTSIWEMRHSFPLWPSAASGVPRPQGLQLVDSRDSKKKKKSFSTTQWYTGGTQIQHAEEN